LGPYLTPSRVGLVFWGGGGWVPPLWGMSLLVVCISILLPLFSNFPTFDVCSGEFWTPPFPFVLLCKPTFHPPRRPSPGVSLTIFLALAYLFFRGFLVRPPNFPGMTKAFICCTFPERSVPFSSFYTWWCRCWKRVAFTFFGSVSPDSSQ